MTTKKESSVVSNMTTKIVYFHGWGSGPDSDSAKKLHQEFPHQPFSCPQIDHTQDPKVIRKQMDKLGEQMKSHGDVVLVGSSAGGFWADYVGSVYGIKTVLVNPSLKPSANFRKYKLPADYYRTYSDMEHEIKKHARHHMLAFAGDKDDVVPLHHITPKYNSPIMLAGEGHRLNDMAPVFKMVRSLIGNFPEHQ